MTDATGSRAASTDRARLALLWALDTAKRAGIEKQEAKSCIAEIYEEVDPNRITCPTCGRAVSIRHDNGRIAAHNNSQGETCPASRLLAEEVGNG